MSNADDDREPPPGRMPGWVVVCGLLAVVSVGLGFLTWLVRDSFAPLLNKLAAWIA